MEHSEAYQRFLQKVSPIGWGKEPDFNPELFDKIYDFERKEVEETLLKLFYSGDFRGNEFFPKFKTVDGIAILKEKMEQYPTPNYVKAEIAHILLKATDDIFYEDVLYENLKVLDELNRTNILTWLYTYRKTQRIFTACTKLCINDVSDYVRFSAARGLLYCADIINKSDLEYRSGKYPYRYLMNALASYDVDVQNKAFEEFNELNKSEFR